MDPSLFDHISKRLAEHRLSRRQTIAAGVAGAAGLAAAATITPAGAAPAQPSRKSAPLRLHGAQAHAPVSFGTPEAEEEAKDLMFLFLQSFGPGSLVPKPDDPDRYILTMSHGLGETIYFSDRPARVFGSVPTPVFLDALGFTPTNPPNAALIGQRGVDDKEVVVLELFDPNYDTSTNTVTYEVILLEDWRKLGDTFAVNTDEEDKHHAREFTAAHLFIDDCPDAHYICVRSEGWENVVIGELPQVRGTCWDWTSISCQPCKGLGAAWTECDRTFPECEGKCFLELQAA